MYMLSKSHTFTLAAFILLFTYSCVYYRLLRAHLLRYTHGLALANFALMREACFPAYTRDQLFGE